MPEIKKNPCPHIDGIEKGRSVVVWVSGDNPIIHTYRNKYGDEFIVEAVTCYAVGGCPIFHVSKDGICIGQFPASLFTKKP